MKKTRIRLSALALSFVLLLSLFSSTAFAQEPELFDAYDSCNDFAFAQESYSEYEYGSAAAEITSAEKEYRFWATGDSRWKDMPLGSSDRTVYTSGSTVVAVAKIIMQAGLNKEPDFNVATFVTWLNDHYGFTSEGYLSWANAAGYSTQLTYKGPLVSGTAMDSSKYIDDIMNWLKQGYHLVIASSGNHWFAVDEGRSLATGEIYIMDSRTISTEYNTGMLLTETYPTISSINAYIGGTTHKHTLKENLDPATCESRGYLELECTTCGESYLKEILTPLGHDIVTTTVAPTCSAQGYTLHSCTRGDFSEKTDFTAMTGHNFVETKVEATCIAQGYTFRDCTNCEYTDKINFTPPLDHDYVKTVVDATETEKGYTKYECFRCPYSYIDASSYVDPHTHNWGEWKITEASTATTYGTRTYTCTEKGCCAVKTEPLAWLCAFTDVPSNMYYYIPVIWAAGRTPMITAGTSPTTFEPEIHCNRAEVVTFLWRYAGSPEPTCPNPFTDINESNFFYKAVLWAYENGITYGTTATTFSPYDAVTRGQFVSFLYRLDGMPPLLMGDNPFEDLPSDSYYYKAVLWAREHGITYGVDKTHFGPEINCTRAQVVSFLYRYCGV